MNDSRRAVAAPDSARSLRLAGTTIKGRYRLSRIAAVSREAVVYEAEDFLAGRQLALQVLREEFAADADFVAAVREQARKLTKSGRAHRGLVWVYACDATDEGDLFVALERTQGRTLREVLDRRGALDPDLALRVATQIGEALEALHHSEIVHGELRPEAVLVAGGDDGMDSVKLVGVELTAAHRTAIGLRVRDASLLPYLAPEQKVERPETTEATDVYALGLLLREMLAAPRVGDSAPSPDTTATLPTAIDRILTRALDPRPDQRYADISVMVNDMWGAQSELDEPNARLYAGTRRLIGSQRPAPRARSSRLGIATPLIAGGVIVAAIVSVALSERITSRVRAGIAAPAAAPGERASALPAVDTAPAEPPRVAAPDVSAERPGAPPPAVSAEQTPAAPERGDVEEAAAAVRSRSVPAAPAVVRQQPPTPPTARTPQPAAPAEKTPAAPERGRVEDAAAVRPRSASSTPAVVRQQPPAPPSASVPQRQPVEARPPAQRPTTPEPRSDGDDGSAIIDWLLKERR